MTARKDILPTLDPMAFAQALVLAPFAVALVFFWALLIPVLALPFGLVPYLVFGTPVLIWMATRYPPKAGPFAMGGLLAQFLFVIGLQTWGFLAEPNAQDLVLFFLIFGTPIAPLWFVAFAMLYRHFWRPVLPPLPAPVALA